MIITKESTHDGPYIISGIISFLLLLPYYSVHCTTFYVICHEKKAIVEIFWKHKGKMVAIMIRPHVNLLFKRLIHTCVLKGNLMKICKIIQTHENNIWLYF